MHRTQKQTAADDQRVRDFKNRWHEADAHQMQGHRVEYALSPLLDEMAELRAKCAPTQQERSVLADQPYARLLEEKSQVLEWLEVWGNTLASVEGCEEAIPDLREVFGQ